MVYSQNLMNMNVWAKNCELVVSGEDPFPGLMLWDNISPQLLKQGASHPSISLWHLCVCVWEHMCPVCNFVRTVLSVPVLICVHTAPYSSRGLILFKDRRDSSGVRCCSTSIMARKQMNAVITVFLIKRWRLKGAWSKTNLLWLRQGMFT